MNRKYRRQFLQFVFDPLSPMFIDRDVMYACFASGRLLLVQEQKQAERLTGNGSWPHRKARSTKLELQWK
jgi:hypothetical protein